MGQTTTMEEPTTSKHAGNVAKPGVPEQEALEQGLPDPLTERQVLETNQGEPKQTTATTSSTQGGLPDTAARGKSVTTISITGLNQEQRQADAEQAAESDGDIVEEIQGLPQDGRQHVYVCRGCGDHYVCHEEISIDEETQRVERAAKRLIGEVQVRGPLENCHRPALRFGHVEMILYVVYRAS
jgi:hypothetical protein